MAVKANTGSQASEVGSLRIIYFLSAFSYNLLVVQGVCSISSEGVQPLIMLNLTYFFMKKLLSSYLSLFAVAALLLATSCGEDEDVALERPSFVVSGIDDVATTTVVPGEPVTFDLSINAPAGFNTLYINKTGGVAQDEIVVSRGATVENTFVYPFSYTPVAAEAGETLVFDFQAVDEAGLDNTYTYTIVVNEPPLVAYQDELLFAPLASGASQTWYNALTGTAYTSSQINSSTQTISDEIDFGYFFGSTELGATLAAPAAYPIAAGQGTWAVRNNTKLKKTGLSASAFTEANSAAAIQTIYNNATFAGNEGRATNLAVGDVVAFKTDPASEGGERLGLLYVTKIVTGTGETGSIQFNVKVVP